MKKNRIFIGIVFEEEGELIDLLPAIAREIGKYDLYSGYIRNTYSSTASAAKRRLKLFSFEKLYAQDKIDKFFMRAMKVKKMAGPRITSFFPGFANERQVVLLQNEPQPEGVCMAPGLWGVIQFYESGGRLTPAPWVQPELGWSDAQKYFNDLRHVCLNQKG